MPLSRIEPERYTELLAEKTARVQQLFTELQPPEPTVFSSAPLHYRMRAEFRLWHEGDELFYAMFRPDAPKDPVRIDHFPVACEPICALMPKLIDAVKDSEVLKKRLFQVEFLSTLKGHTLLTLIYHKKLDLEWEHAARELADKLGVELIGRSKKQKLVLGLDYVEESLAADGDHFHYRQYEGGFTQPNAGVNQAMLSWACQRAGECSGNLIELYCGNGNFTVPLSRHFPQVLATEISKTSVKAARENFVLNAVDNVSVVRMSAEEISSALKGERPFRRLRDIDLDGLGLQTVFVDPPRAGLDDLTRELVGRFDSILYISCNPETLQRDLHALRHSHRIAHFALFDQFPYTDHMECGALLQRIEA